MGDVANDPPTVLLADADMLIDYREYNLDVALMTGSEQPTQQAYDSPMDATLDRPCQPIASA